MKNNFFTKLLLFIALFTSCGKENSYFTKPFFDAKGKHIGDSVFIDNVVNKIVFIDSSYILDSIVFSRYNNPSNSLKSIESYNDGKRIFENIDYYENGNIKKYSFIDEDNSNYFYERLYHSSGALLKVNGYLFFQGYIIDTASKNSDIKKGSTINYRIYYPNPPDCNVKVYIKNDDGTVYNVFSKSKFLNFLQTAYQDNNELGTYKANIFIELKENSIDTIVRYNHEFIYKVVY